MATRILLILTSVIGVLGLAYVLLSLFAVTSVDNGVSHHIIAGGGVMRGAFMLLVALVLGLIALAVRS